MDRCVFTKTFSFHQISHSLIVSLSTWFTGSGISSNFTVTEGAVPWVSTLIAPSYALIERPVRDPFPTLGTKHCPLRSCLNVSGSGSTCVIDRSGGYCAHFVVLHFRPYS